MLNNSCSWTLKERSAALRADPKAQELRHFIGSREHESRLRNAAGLVEREPSTSLDRDIKALRDMEADMYRISWKNASECEARLQWRAQMDRTIGRLMQDADFALDDRIKDGAKHQLRCQALDNTYSWYEQHARKEGNKERPAPSYISYDGNAPIMPGSLRAPPRPSSLKRAMPQPPSYEPEGLPTKSRSETPGSGVPARHRAHSFFAVASQAVGKSPTPPRSAGGLTARRLLDIPKGKAHERKTAKSQGVGIHLESVGNDEIVSPLLTPSGASCVSGMSSSREKNGCWRV